MFSQRKISYVLDNYILESKYAYTSRDRTRDPGFDHCPIGESKVEPGGMWMTSNLSQAANDGSIMPAPERDKDEASQK